MANDPPEGFTIKELRAAIAQAMRTNPELIRSAKGLLSSKQARANGSKLGRTCHGQVR